MENVHKGVLYIIICGSGPAPSVYNLVPIAQEAGWDVCTILTPMAKRFVDAAKLEHMTGHAARSDYKQPDELEILPRADAIIVYPATFNTINKWALGISDTLAISLLCEYTGLKKPIIAIPMFSTGGGLDTHPAFHRSVQLLEEYGVHVLYHPQTYPPYNDVPHKIILDTLHGLLPRLT